MSDKRDERDPFESRYGGSESEEKAESEETSENSKTSKTSKTVRERKNVNMYLPESLVEDLNITYSELNVDWMRAHGGDELPKNQEFYPAVIRVALAHPNELHDELDLD